MTQLMCQRREKAGGGAPESRSATSKEITRTDGDKQQHTGRSSYPEISFACLFRPPPSHLPTDLRIACTGVALHRLNAHEGHFFMENRMNRNDVYELETCHKKRVPKGEPPMCTMQGR